MSEVAELRARTKMRDIRVHLAKADQHFQLIYSSEIRLYFEGRK